MFYNIRKLSLKKVFANIFSTETYWIRRGINNVHWFQHFQYSLASFTAWGVKCMPEKANNRLGWDILVYKLQYELCNFHDLIRYYIVPIHNKIRFSCPNFLTIFARILTSDLLYSLKWGCLFVYILVNIVNWTVICLYVHSTIINVNRI